MASPIEEEKKKPDFMIFWLREEFILGENK